MPIYEYECNDCKKRHEIIQKFSDAPLEHCPHCGGSMRKLFSSPAIQFKGSGFYKTDYASGSSKAPQSKTDTKSETKTESSSESKSESKTESKSGSSSAGSKTE